MAKNKPDKKAKSDGLEITFKWIRADDEKPSASGYYVAFIEPPIGGYLIDTIYYNREEGWELNLDGLKYWSHMDDLVPAESYMTRYKRKVA